MERYDPRMQRLFVEADLVPGAVIEADRSQANYLLNVLRLKSGAQLLAFNGRDGEWLMQVEASGRKACVLHVQRQTRPQAAPGDLWYLFAPLKHARLDYMVQKAVEMGVSRLMPVVTQRTQVGRVNTQRMRANAIEAAEQCSGLCLPEIDEAEKLETVLANWPQERHLVFCDEEADDEDALQKLRPLAGKPLGVLIGPEGGFSPEERARLLSMSNVTTIPLGPRILRADTAAVAALALVQAVAGDWAGPEGGVRQT